MEAYVDDMLVKRLRTEDHITHFKEMFDVLRIYGMKPEQVCIWSVLRKNFGVHGQPMSNRGQSRSDNSYP